MYGFLRGSVRRVLQLRAIRSVPRRNEGVSNEVPGEAGWAERLIVEHAHETIDRSREDEVLLRIERVRRARPRIRDERITLAYGAGGKATRSLVEAVFMPAFTNPCLALLEDQAILAVGDARIAFTTDSYVVRPLFFPGGSIGDLAVNGTVNDLAVSGARPIALSAGFILEEGFPVDDLRRIVADMAAAARVAGVQIVTGDTKVVERGKADGCYVNTAGIGAGSTTTLGALNIQPGDVVLVTGPIGDHGVAIMLARGELDIAGDVRSDTASLAGLVRALLDVVPGVRCMRDATRGGVGTVLNEFAITSETGILIEETAIPVRPAVNGACEILGIDPLYVACEGRIVAVVAGADADLALRTLQAHPLGEGAAIIGRVVAEDPGMVLLTTSFGGTRIVDMLVGDPLPRIC